jgi:hypothetical protein
VFDSSQARRASSTCVAGARTAPLDGTTEEDTNMADQGSTGRIPVLVRVPAIVALILVAVIIGTMILGTVGAEGGGHGSGTQTEMTDRNGGEHDSRGQTGTTDHTGTEHGSRDRTETSDHG